MGKLTILLVLGFAVLAGLFFSGVLFPESEPPKPKGEWWGRGPKQPETDTSIREFKVAVSDADLQDLKDRLDRARFTEDLVDTQFQYGFPAREMKKIAEYWKNTFNWRKQEAELNKHKQYKTTIEGIDVHFMRVKPKSGRQGKPLLIVHGWPGSVWEFHKLIPLLTDPAAHGGRDEDAFEVIAPSIPGYGFSEAPHRKGFSAIECARIFVKLMNRLGHDKFYAQGGDWGAFITSALAQLWPRSLHGLHNNMVSIPFSDPRLFVHQTAAGFAPELILGKEHSKHFRPLTEDFLYLLQETGYMHIQATKPDTVGMGLNDSPIGLAGYILEKFSTWTNKRWIDLPDGGLTKKYTLDELLTNIMIYWISGNIASSQRFYKENFSQFSALDRVPINVPCGLAIFPEELAIVPKPLAEYKFKDIVQYSYMPSGGHFAAFEEPELVAEDFFSFVEKLEKRDTIIHSKTTKERAEIKPLKEEAPKEQIKERKIKEETVRTNEAPKQQEKKTKSAEKSTKETKNKKTESEPVKSKPAKKDSGKAKQESGKKDKNTKP